MGQKKIKVVLDTNVLLSALLWKTKEGRILELVKKNKIEICVTKEMLEEFERVLNYKYIQSWLKEIEKEPKDIIMVLFDIVNFYPSVSFKDVHVKADPDDDIFLGCALSSKADYVISKDKHLLNIKEYQGIPIVSPSEFRKHA